MSLNKNRQMCLVLRSGTERKDEVYIKSLYLPIYILFWSHGVGDLLSVDAVNRVQRQLHYEPMNTAVLIDLCDAP